MKTINHYLSREVVITWRAVTVILVLVSVSCFLGDALSAVIRGKITSSLVFMQLSLKTVGALNRILPLSLFYGILLAYGRLYRDSEMVVLGSCGIGPIGLLRPLGTLFVFGAPVLLALTMVVSPWAARKSDEMRQQVASVLSLSALQAGRFTRLPGDNGTVFVESLSAEGDSFENIFIHSISQNRRDIVTAKRGYQERDPESGEQFLILQEGFRTEGIPGQADYRVLSFERNEIKLAPPEPNRDSSEIDASSLSELLQQGDLVAHVELQWRLAPVISIFPLLLLAVPLSRSAPRQSRYGRVVVGMLTYLFYANMLGIGRTWLDEGVLPLWVGLWWVHLLFLVPGLVWVVRAGRSR